MTPAASSLGVRRLGVLRRGATVSSTARRRFRQAGRRHRPDYARWLLRRYAGVVGIGDRGAKRAPPWDALHLRSMSDGGPTLRR